MHRDPDCPNGQRQSRVASETESCALAVGAWGHGRTLSWAASPLGVDTLPNGRPNTPMQLTLDVTAGRYEGRPSV